MSLPELPEGFQWVVAPQMHSFSVGVGLYDDPYDGRYGAVESVVVKLEGCATEDAVVAAVEGAAQGLWDRLERKVTLSSWVNKNFPAKEDR